MLGARTKRLLGLTLALVTVVPLSLLAARWQWNRHIDRDGRNAAVVNAMEFAPVPWEQLLMDGFQADEEWRRVTFPADWVAGEQYFLRKQVVNGSTGFLVVQASRVPDGRLAYVLLGWSATAQPVELSALPTKVSVRLRPVVGDAPVRPADLPEGQINRVDPGFLAAPTGTEAAPVVLELIDGVPSTLVAVPLPELDGGPHVSYTGQWLLIGLTGLIVYAVLVRREFQSPDSDVPAN